MFLKLDAPTVLEVMSDFLTAGVILFVGVIAYKLLKEIKMTLDEVAVKVTEQRTVIDSGVVLLGQLADLVRQNAQDPVKIQEIADAIDAGKQVLADAIAASDDVLPSPQP